MKKLTVFSMLFIGLCIAGGGMLGLYLIELKEPGRSGGLFLPIVVGNLLGIGTTFIVWLIQKKRHGNVPTVDERTLQNLKKFYAAALYLVLFGSGGILIILFLMDVQTIEVGMLFIYMMVLFIVLGVGTMLAKRV
ncbi:hypothetical protein JFL43_04710 [Viridibacillus sp. YIM B01967]|uniref:Uncharacterized protein n=1 Tax=Viridibacillus soli TaxID=2798301 RepID=A0ABS1H419_9BACL|nr:hypothetical protein [Viridibacillus soli]MBK3494169.1 hypothetical protein [Viridibacillus soli]